MEGVRSEIEDLRKQLVTCRRIYKYLDGVFGYNNWNTLHHITVRPAREHAYVIVVNGSPIETPEGPRFITQFHTLTRQELDAVIPEYTRRWCESEAVFYAAEYGNLFNIDAYVLSPYNGELLGRQGALKEGKAAFAVEYYNVTKRKEELLNRKKVIA